MSSRAVETGGPTSVSAIDVPFEIPKSWRWTRLGEIGVWGAGATPNKSFCKYFENGTIPWLLTGDLNDGLITKIPNVITECALKETSVKLNPQGSVLIAMYGATIGKVGVLNIPATTNQACCACRPFGGIVNWYLFYFLMSQRDAFISRGEGGAQSNISKEKIVATLFPLPPLAEQKRIVAKIEQLMPLVEEYGKMEDARLQLDADLPAALEKSILQEAIQGKLVPQDPNGEPASELLKRIAAERKALVKAGKLKRDKGESVIFRGSDRLAYETRNGETVCIQDEIPFEIPDSWEWVRLGNLINFISGVSYNKDDVAKSGIRILRGGNIKGDGKLYLWEDDVFLPETYSNKENEIHKDDVVIVAATGSSTVIGRAAVAPADMAGVQIGAFLRIARPLFVEVNAWIALIFHSPFYRQHIQEKAKGTNIRNLKTEYVTDFMIPLPPLAEQKRIVAKIEELRAVIKSLTM